MKKRQPQTIGAILSGISRQYGFQSHLKVHKLQKNWERIVGPQLAEHTFPAQIRFGKLHLLVDGPVWTQQLNFIQKKLLDQIRVFDEKIGVEEICCRVGVIPQKKPVLGEEEKEAQSLSKDALAFIQESLRPIKDPEIQDSLRKVMFRALGRKRTKSN